MSLRDHALLVVLAGPDSDSSVVLRKINPDVDHLRKNNTDNPDNYYNK